MSTSPREAGAGLGARRPRTIVLAALGLAAVVALLAASTMSYLDWRLNPGGIFRGEDGTSWTVVWETWVSWFVPVLLLAAAVVLPVALWSARGR